jgi:dihydrolipoamide dehydrogenase
VLGAHLAGPQASELIGTAVLAIEMGATVEDLAQMVLPHPTLSELYGEAARLAQGLPVQVPLARPRPGNPAGQPDR